MCSLFQVVFCVLPPFAQCTAYVRLNIAPHAHLRGVLFKRDEQVYPRFFNASFIFSELKAFSASVNKTVSAWVLLC